MWKYLVRRYEMKTSGWENRIITITTFYKDLKSAEENFKITPTQSRRIKEAIPNISKIEDKWIKLSEQRAKKFKDLIGEVIGKKLKTKSRKFLNYNNGLSYGIASPEKGGVQLDIQF
jgi:hypothetical protein